MLQGDSLHLQGLWQLSSGISTQQLIPSVHLVIKRLEETKHQRIKSDITSLLANRSFLTLFHILLDYCGLGHSLGDTYLETKMITL